MKIIQMYLLIFILLISSTIFQIEAQSIKNQFYYDAPSGKYSIGTTEFDLIDSNRKETFDKRAGYRRIYVKVWYPAVENQSEPWSKYISSYSSDLIYSIFKTQGISKSFLDSVKQLCTHSKAGIPFLEDKQKYPVIFFTQGFYFGMVDLYSAFIENLVSRGYIIVGITHPYEQPYVRFSDGREVYLEKKKAQIAYLQLLLTDKLQFRELEGDKNIEIITRNYLRKLKRFDKALDLWVDDTRFVLDCIENGKTSILGDAIFKYADLSKIGAWGQSFGGAVSGQLCLKDERIKAGVNMDCFQFGDIINDSLKKPFMLIESRHYTRWNKANQIIYKSNKNDFFKLTLLDSKHFVFSDIGILPYLPISERARFIGAVDGAESIKTINKYVSEFFDLYLRGNETNLFTNSFKNNKLDFFISK